jgi:hypothetical protein
VQVCLDQLHCSEKSVSDEKKNEKKEALAVSERISVYQEKNALKSHKYYH